MIYIVPEYVHMLIAVHPLHSTGRLGVANSIIHVLIATLASNALQMYLHYSNVLVQSLRRLSKVVTIE